MIPPPTPADLSRSLESDYADATGRPEMFRAGVLVAGEGWPAAIRRAVAAEMEAIGLAKANALLNLGMESQCELMDKLKQECRRLKKQLEQS